MGTFDLRNGISLAPFHPLDEDPMFMKHTEEEAVKAVEAEARRKVGCGWA